MLIPLVGMAAALVTRLSFASVPGTCAAQAVTHKPSRKSKSEVRAKDLVVPFRVGETLKYQVSWSAFATAANVEISVPEHRELYGWQAWHFRAVARTLNPVRRLFTIDDQFDSYTDATTFETRQYEQYLNEMGRSLNQQWRFVRDGETTRAPGPAVVVLSGTRDPLGFLFGLRSIDWRKTTDVHWPVYDGHNLYDVRANLEELDDRELVLAGTFSTTRVAIRVLQHGTEVPGINFAVWIANEAEHAPVLMKAQLQFGSLEVQLVSSTK